ncbi:MAG: hypothetical protein FWH03_04245 [Firmicutes bacterium]|nr:hypothetical protein [Bacillota bacterium]
MENTEENNQSVPQDKGVAAVAVKAAYGFFIAATLFCTLFVMIFPYPSMLLYDTLGLDKRTYAMSERVVSRMYSEDAQWDSRFAVGLYFAVDLSTQFMRDDIANKGYGHRTTLRSAEKVVKYTDMHEKFSFVLRDRMVEDAMLANPRFIPDWHPNLFSHRAFVRSANFQARYITDSFENLYTYFIGSIIPQQPNFLAANIMDDYAVRLLELNAVLSAELDDAGFHFPQDRLSGENSSMAYIVRKQISPSRRFRLLYNPNTIHIGEYSVAAGKTPLLERIEAQIGEIWRFIHNFDTSAPTLALRRQALLRRAHWARAVSLLASNIRIITEIFEASPTVFESENYARINQMHKDWMEVHDRYIQEPDTGALYPLSLWYRNIILEEYKSTFTA